MVWPIDAVTMLQSRGWDKKKKMMIVVHPAEEPPRKKAKGAPRLLGDADGDIEVMWDRLTADEQAVCSNVHLHSKFCPVGIATHWFFEHGCEPFLAYEFNIAATVMCEEPFESIFLHVTDTVPRICMRRVKYEDHAEQIGQTIMEMCLFGCPGADKSGRHERGGRVM